VSSRGFYFSASDPLEVSLAGVFIHACRCNDGHLVMYRGDSTLLDAILSPMCDTMPTPSASASNPQIAFVNSKKEHVKKVARKKMFEYVNLQFIHVFCHIFHSLEFTLFHLYSDISIFKL
jgi:hypothetical protein